MDQIFKQFKQVEEIYRELVEGLNDLVLAVDLDGRFIYLSDSLEKMLGYTPSDLLGKKVTDFIHPDDHAQFQVRAFDTVAETLPIVEYRIRAKNGEYRWYKSLSKKLMLGDDICGRFGVLNDITKQKKAEEKLLLSEFKYKNIFQNLLDVYVETSLDGVILEISPSIKKLIGYTREELLGKSGLIHYVNTEDRDRHVKALKKEGKSNYHNLNLYHKNGSTVPISVSAILSQDEQGNEYIISMVRDERERKQTELLLQESEERLRQAQKMESIGNLAGGIAHDFNNILSAIFGYTELSLNSVEKGSQIEQDLQEIFAAGYRAKDLVNQILTFARQSDDKLKPIQVDSILKEVLRFLRSSIPTTIEIKQDIKSTARIIGNATQVHQMIMNLCTNATHAMEDGGGCLEVSLKDIIVDSQTREEESRLKFGKYIEIKVSDTGSGIEPGILNRVFEPYFTTKQAGEGTGMGLALVHGIVESYGGKIFIDSTLGKGTVFTVYIPTTKNTESSQTSYPEQLPGGKERILFVDDEIQIVKLAARTLKRLGYSVKSKLSSIEALELFRSNPYDYDLVISDMTMPRMSGDQLASKLMSIRPDIPIILCTGYSKKLSEEKALNIGIKAIVCKPFVKKELAKTIRQVLDAKKK